MDSFVNRTRELAALDRWWQRDEQLAVVWGRRRVGKTALVQQFATGKTAVFHTGARRGEPGELALLAEQVARALPGGLRDVEARPYRDWDDALDDLATRAETDRVLLVLDEFPELVDSSPALPAVLRAFGDRARGRTRLRVLLCGSAVRHMQALQEEREPLYGRFDLALPVHPFTPREAALLLQPLAPSERAVVYGIVGGMPLYLTWWDTDASVADNLARLVCEPGGRLLTEGDLVIRTDVEGGDHAQRVLNAVAAGKTTYAEIKSWVGAEPARTIDRLIELRLLERVRPAGAPERAKRRRYRIADPFLRFHLSLVGRFRTEIDRGLGQALVPTLVASLDDHMGDVWEEAFRRHLRDLAASGTLDVDGHVVEVGLWWDAMGGNEIDALVLAGRSRRPAMAGEAKWARSVDAGTIVGALRRKVEQGLSTDADGVAYVVCARSEVRDVPPGLLALTAEDLFAAGSTSPIES